MLDARSYLPSLAALSVTCGSERKRPRRGDPPATDLRPSRRVHLPGRDEGLPLREVLIGLYATSGAGDAAKLNADVRFAA